MRQGLVRYSVSETMLIGHIPILVLALPGGYLLKEENCPFLLKDGWSEVRTVSDGAVFRVADERG